MEPYIGEIRCFGFNFPPFRWALCNGQLLSIQQNEALFAILGTAYGGDGQTTFALPNLQGRSPMHWGDSNTGLNTVIGQTLGETQVTLTTNQIPRHSHTIYSTDVQARAGQTERTAGPKASGASYLSESNGSFLYQSAPSTPNTAFNDNAISTAGGSQPHENMQPYLTLNFCISLFGLFPSRN